MVKNCDLGRENAALESVDFYLTSRGYRILFKNEFPLL